MGRIWVQTCESAIRHRRDGTAAGDAQTAIPLHLPYVRNFCGHAQTPSWKSIPRVAVYGCRIVVARSVSGSRRQLIRRLSAQAAFGHHLVGSAAEALD